jgi:hypothetical protein
VVWASCFVLGKLLIADACASLYPEGQAAAADALWWIAFISDYLTHALQAAEIAAHTWLCMLAAIMWFVFHIGACANTFRHVQIGTVHGRLCHMNSSATQHHTGAMLTAQQLCDELLQAGCGDPMINIYVLAVTHKAA